MSEINTPAVPDTPAELPPLVGRYVIASYSHGSLEVHECTVDRAMKLFEDYKQGLPQQVTALIELQKTGTTAVSADLIATILVEAAGGIPVGEPFPRLRRFLYGGKKKDVEDTRPDVIVTPEMQVEALLWSARAGILANKISSYDVQKLEAHKHISFLTLGQPIALVDGDWVFDTARDLRTIQEGRWKPTASEQAKVRFILRFIKEHLSGRHLDSLEVVQIT